MRKHSKTIISPLYRFVSDIRSHRQSFVQLRWKFGGLAEAEEALLLPYDSRVDPVLGVDLGDLCERLVDEYDGDEDGETLFREPRDVADQGAEVERNDDEKGDCHPETNPETERHEVQPILSERYFHISISSKYISTLKHTPGPVFLQQPVNAVYTSYILIPPSIYTVCVM